MKVAPRATSQPAAKTAYTATAAGPASRHSTAGSGCHAASSVTRTAPVATTNVARSACAPNSRADRRLTAPRAMTVCWTANSSSSAASMATAAGQGVPAAESMFFGTPQRARKPIV